MLLVLADDFSGAAEIGGIGHRYGLNTEVQLQLNLNSPADLIVLDTDTRSSPESDAVVKISQISALIKKSKKPVLLFKKIDSVMRGHLIPEINALQDCFGFVRVLVLPANPNRGRKIVSGNYFVNGTLLTETVFAQDPDFPVVSADITRRIQSHPCLLNHVHVTPEDLLPEFSIITGDAESQDDLRKYVAKTGADDLCCGAAGLFESYLEKLGYSPRLKKSLSSGNPSVAMIINGSTVKNPQEGELYRQLKIPQLSFPYIPEASAWRIPEGIIHDWYQQIVNTLRASHVAVISIDHPAQHDKAVSQMFLNYFVELIQYITGHMDMGNIHFGLTGGATASSIIRHLDGGNLYVKEEIAPGVVSLVMMREGIQQGLFTVKPGSYPWPASFIQSLLPMAKL